ncbi:hypothetical protein GCM10018793_20390 [Streptomyces sulfonofaciens]|uniref:Uncharacterized protein n=1 Tax=Streptomyces sulfonofaciens TaxID=68272 RepID=A0A919KWE0_9ACTN|nr:hypothetical protein GCM10018793_20390 [Streptomyces sulfonofaciens]
MADSGLRIAAPSRFAEPPRRPLGDARCSRAVHDGLHAVRRPVPTGALAQVHPYGRARPCRRRTRPARLPQSLRGGSGRSSGCESGHSGPTHPPLPGVAHCVPYQKQRTPGSVKVRTGGYSPRPGRIQWPVDQVEFLDRR